MTRTMRRLGAARRNQHDHLALLARHDPSIGAVVVQHRQPAAYCLPGRHGTVVVTSAAMERLDREQLAAVVAHEYAHLHGGHGLLLAVAESLSQAFPFVTSFAVAHDKIGVLAEMIADDAASKHGDPTVLAAALVQLALRVPSMPTGTLAAGAVAAAERVRRLADPPRRLKLGQRLALAAGIVAVALAPLVIAAAPAIAIISSVYCPARS